MAVVVTGAAGFLGRALVDRLRRAGHDVVGVDRRPAPEPGTAHLQAELGAGDPDLRDLLASATAVAHLAGAPGVRDVGWDADLRRRRDNVEATRAVLAAVRPGTPLLVTSSSSVYGGARAGRPSAEDDPLDPRGGYARSKAEVEALCAARAATGGRVAVLRPFTVAGEHQRPDMALSSWLRAVAVGEPVRVLGSLARTRDVTDVQDVAEVALRVLERGVTGPLNVGTGRARSLAELLAAVEGAVDRPARLVVTPAPAVEVPATLADTRRLARLIGHVPETDLASLLRRQLAASTRQLDRAQTAVLAATP